jgi:hypothetical protein
MVNQFEDGKIVEMLIKTINVKELKERNPNMPEQTPMKQSFPKQAIFQILIE